MTKTETYNRQQDIFASERHHRAVDELWFDKLMRITEGLREFYSYLTIPEERKPEVLAAWHSGEPASLIPTDSQIDQSALNTKIAELKVMKSEIIDGAIDSNVRQLYLWKINELVGQIHLLISAKRGNMQGYRRWNQYIYGVPNELVYRAGVDWVAAAAEEAMGSSDDKSIIDASLVVVRMLDGDRGYRELLTPDETVFKKVKEDHMKSGGFYDLLLGGMFIPDVVTEKEGDPLIRQLVNAKLGSDYKIESGYTSWSVSHSTKTIKKPSTYTYTKNRFIGLVLGHEIGTHLLEKINGERGPLMLGSIGLDRFENGSEGRAVVREQVPYDTFEDFSRTVRWRDIIRRHLAISYAWGTGGFRPKTSSEVYAFMQPIDRFFALVDGKDEIVARDRTDSLLLRVLKGTDGSGYAYLKDKSYLEGNVNAWLEAEMHGEQVIRMGDAAKQDIHNHRHIGGLAYVGRLE